MGRHHAPEPAPQPTWLRGMDGRLHARLADGFVAVCGARVSPAEYRMGLPVACPGCEAALASSAADASLVEV